MRVAYLTNLYPTVSHSFIRREIFALERQGFEVVRYAFRGWDTDLVDPDDIAEQARTRHTLRNGLGPLLGTLLKTAFAHPVAFGRAARLAWALSKRAHQPRHYYAIYLAHACQLLMWLKDAPVDHLHAHFATNPGDVACLLKALGGPSYSFTVHGPGELDNANRLHLREKLAGAEFAVGISRFTVSQVMRETDPNDWGKLHVVHCGLEDSAFADPLPDMPETPTFLLVGRLSAVKGHILAIDAFAQIASDIPNASMVFVGDGDLRPSLERAVAEAGLEGRVTFLGWQSAEGVRDAVRRASVLVQPSFAEGLPVVIMEAMAQGRPAIASQVNGMPELVRPGETGWLVPPGDVAALSDAMIAAARLPTQDLERLGRNAFNAVSERHRVDASAKTLADLISKSN